jgi:Homing endonuclease associated repeat
VFPPVLRARTAREWAPRSENVKKQEVMAAILACAEKLGHVPSVPDLMKHERIDRTEIRKHFGNYRHALEECKLEVPEWGRRVEIDRLFQDWAGVVRKLKKLPTLFEYERLGKYSGRPLRRRFGSWLSVPEGMKLYAEERGLAGEWMDVLELVNGQRGGQGEAAGVSSARAETKMMDDRPTYGPLIGLCAHVYGPTNENGVVCLFGAMAERLGFLILRIQAGYPDCEAMRVVGEGRLQPVRIEFEYESRNFLRHMHDPAGCDLIVCWEHNWEDCPLEVVELRSAVGRPEIAVIAT